MKLQSSQITDSNGFGFFFNFRNLLILTDGPFNILSNKKWSHTHYKQHEKMDYELIAIKKQKRVQKFLDSRIQSLPNEAIDILWNEK